MRVVLTIHSAELYGAGRSLLDHARVMRDAGFDMSVLLPAHGALVDALENDGISTVVSPSSESRAFYRFAVQQFREMGRPLCHVHSKFPLTAALAARRAGSPVLWHVREERQRSYECRTKPVRRIGSHVLSEARRFAIGRLSQHIVYVSEAVRKQFDLPGIPGDVLFNFLPRMPNLPPRRSDDGVLTLLYAGRVCLEKGAEEFALVCRGLLDRGVPFRAVMAGALHPDYADYPERLAAMGLDKHVSLAGYQNSLDDMYRDMDVLLFPSHTEGFGRPVMEAMARGVVPVASRVGGIPEMIEHGRNGFLFDPACPAEAVEILGRLADERGLWIEMSGKARGDATRMFSADPYVRKMSRIYRTFA